MKPHRSFHRPAPTHDLGDLAAQAHQALLDKDARHLAAPLHRRTGRWWRAAALGSAMVIAGFLAWYAQTHAPAPSPQQLERGRLAVVSLISASLADHLRAFGGYPERLEDVLPLPADIDVTYRRQGTGYELEIRDGGGHVLTVRHG